MQKWRRDRSRRRSKPAGSPEEQGPAPLIPAYPEEVEAQAQREFALRQAQREAEATRGTAQKQQPPSEIPEAAVEQQPEREAQPAKRSRRRKRKSGGSQQGSPAATAEVPGFDPGYATGEAAEVELPETPAEMPEEPKNAEEAASAPAVAPVAPPLPLPKNTKGAVVLAVGLPGSGKSTWFKRRGVTPLSSDLLRHILFDNVQEQRHQDLVFSTLRSLLRARLIARMPWNYVDATNLSPKERKHWIRMAQDFGFEAHAVYFDVPLEVCMERNAKRHRVVPAEIMQRMSQKLRQPTFDEGFTRITVVRVKQKGDTQSAEQISEE